MKGGRMRFAACLTAGALAGAGTLHVVLQGPAGAPPAGILLAGALWGQIPGIATWGFLEHPARRRPLHALAGAAWAAAATVLLTWLPATLMAVILAGNAC